VGSNPTLSAIPRNPHKHANLTPCYRSAIASVSIIIEKEIGKKKAARRIVMWNPLRLSKSKIGGE
jgi:hypothetical protein